MTTDVRALQAPARAAADAGVSPLISLDGVSKRFAVDGAALTAVDDVSFSVAQGSFVGIVGPSGCGKTTLLNLIAGFIPTTTGTIRIDGQAVGGIDPDLGVGYVTQENKLFPWLSLAANVEFPLRARGWGAVERHQRVSELLELAGLRGFEDRYPYQLSGGMQKRAALIQTLSYEPSVLLMDEPFGSLDAQTRMLLQDELLRIWRRRHKTILFVTHDLTEAIALCDRVLVTTARPARLKGEEPIAIPRPRDVFHIHRAPGYQACYDALWELVRDELIPPDPTASP